MKTNSKVIQALIKYRITIVCLCFAALMIIGFWVSLIIGATSENNGISKTISNYILTIIFISVLLLGAFFLITGMLKSKMRKESVDLVKDESEIIKSYDEAMSFGFRKVRIFFACPGSFIALTIIVVSLCILFGFQDYLETIFMAIFYIGGPVWLLLTWKFFSIKLN